MYSWVPECSLEVADALGSRGAMSRSHMCSLPFKAAYRLSQAVHACRQAAEGVLGQNGCGGGYGRRAGNPSPPGLPLEVPRSPAADFTLSSRLSQAPVRHGSCAVLGVALSAAAVHRAVAAASRGLVGVASKLQRDRAPLPAVEPQSPCVARSTWTGGRSGWERRCLLLNARAFCVPS